jgi:AcrR family transcriptional regulator
MVRKLRPERRTEFLNAALKLFVAKGVQHTSTAEIARKAGTAAGTLFLYFPTKQDLVKELILNISRDQSEYINSLLVPSFPVRKTFLTIWEGSIRWFLEHMDEYQYAQQVRDPRIIGEKTAKESEKFFQYYFAAVQKGLEEKQIKPYPFELIGGMLYQNIIAVVNLAGAQADPEKRKAYIQMGFEIFWNGIKKGAAERTGDKGRKHEL